MRLTRLLATVHPVMRLPVRPIRVLLPRVYGCEVRLGEIMQVLHRLVAHAQPVLDDRLAEIRRSPAIQADETGWRADGVNGSIGSGCPPSGRSDESHHARAEEVVTPVSGENVQGMLSSDVSAGYHTHQGFHQRGWAHCLREIHTRQDTCPQDEEVLRWANAITDQ